jgi:hypothetical protein
MIFFFILGLCYLILFNLSPLRQKGDAFFLELFNIEKKLYSGELPGIYKLPAYKFFAPLIANLMEYSRVFGLSPNLFIPQLRKYLGRDLKFERRMNKLFFGGLAQMLIVFFLSWSFGYYMSEALSFPVNFSLQPLFLQLTGGIFYILIFTLLRRYLLSPFNHFFISYYRLWALMKVGHSMGEILQKSEIYSLSSNRAVLKEFQSKIRDPLKAWEEKGVDIILIVELLLEQLWDIYTEELVKFRGIFIMATLAILAIFFLSAYFLIIWDVLGPFLIELKQGPRYFGR